VVVEGKGAIGDEDVISGEPAPRTDPDWPKPGGREALEERVGENVTGPARKEDSVSEVPTPDRVFLSPWS